MTTVCHRPEGLEQLEAQTNFTKQELQILYRGFKNVTQTLILDYFGTGAQIPSKRFRSPIFQNTFQHLELLMLPSQAQLEQTCATSFIRLYLQPHTALIHTKNSMLAITILTCRCLEGRPKGYQISLLC